jgi:hypothetical protein
MTASDLPGYNPDGTPDYDQDEVAIGTELRLNGNGTVSITYQNVPYLDLPELLYQQGTDEGIADMLDQLAALLLEQLYSFPGGGDYFAL